MDIDAWKRATGYAARERDKRLRKNLLIALHASRATPSGWTAATTLRDLAEGAMPADQKFDDEKHCISLCRDLVLLGAVEERQVTRRNEVFGLRHLEFRILARGVGLVEETMPPEPLIDDDRMMPES